MCRSGDRKILQNATTSKTKNQCLLFEMCIICECERSKDYV